MKSFSVLLSAAILILVACTKSAIVKSIGSQSSTPGSFVKYTIRKGQQYCDRDSFKAVSVTDLKFIARFDSSAIYQTADPENQYDINKLYGFSDNNSDHHSYSARFGWRWSDNALHLFAYVYNEGSMSSKEIGTAQIGTDIKCEIKVDSTSYVFSLNGFAMSMPRMSKTVTGAGYQLYPYFGGTETAPHDISIWIKDGY